ncbi:MAG: hypothetical protein WDN04_19940 [Rhodospirillales bacterium]
MPPLGHWLYFLPRVRQSRLDHDGHPARGDFLPPVPLPRRMWAGRAPLRFTAQSPPMRPLQRRSSITDVTHKRGGSGDLVFVSVTHEIYAQDTLAVSEVQTLVYRDAAGEAPAPAAPPPRPSDTTRRLTPDPVQLFRFPPSRSTPTGSTTIMATRAKKAMPAWWYRAPTSQPC